MIVYPAIDLYNGKAVRLYKGDYQQMTVYNDRPEEVAADFVRRGATHIHLVDLEGAKTGDTPNLPTVCAIKQATGLFCEVGGGVRSPETVARYIDAGIDRVILGTAAVKDRAFLEQMLARYGEKIAVGVDMKDGMVAIHGWTERSALDGMAFCEEMESIGVSTLIVTDISRDGAMKGTNHPLYRRLAAERGLQIIASGGVSSLDDVRRLSALGLHGAIIGKAYYTGAVDLKEAIEVAK
ncbi:MAG: 1-(5-phosphoribosyl)-5-[(5-phosphoribosylamino)methylideneamino]imidazole-4-carboxamide isomerase [Acutalibacteraceae bacterium]|jgi:phosphoribosylformimino-5-aminoimidazole carboxamide ribotide isomerase